MNLSQAHTFIDVDAHPDTLFYIRTIPTLSHLKHRENYSKTTVSVNSLEKTKRSTSCQCQTYFSFSDLVQIDSAKNMKMQDRE